MSKANTRLLKWLLPAYRKMTRDFADFQPTLLFLNALNNSSLPHFWKMTVILKIPHAFKSRTGRMVGQIYLQTRQRWCNMLTRRSAHSNINWALHTIRRFSSRIHVWKSIILLNWYTCISKEYATFTSVCLVYQYFGSSTRNSFQHFDFDGWL